MPRSKQDVEVIKKRKGEAPVERNDLRMSCAFGARHDPRPRGHYCPPHESPVKIARRENKCRWLRHRQRNGLSLLETMMAVTVLLGSVLALSQLASVGRMHAQRAARMTQAQILCQNKMAEIAAGVDLAIPVVDQPFPSAPGWAYTIEVQPTTWQHLVAVEVSVGEVPLAGELLEAPSNVMATATEIHPVFRLVRWLPVSSDFEMLGEETEGERATEGEQETDQNNDDGFRQNVAGEELLSRSAGGFRGGDRP